MLPVAKGVNADLEGTRELFLAEADEAAEGDDISAGLDLTVADPPADGRWDHALEISFGELGNVQVVSHP